MQNFEIKIFANPSGFQELKLNNAENLFTKEIADKRNFDGDYGTFKDGTFSVLFTNRAFIIDYIFNVVADAGFRDPQTHIAIAIERGYKLKDAYQVFTRLRKEFNLIAAEYKVNIARSLYNRSETFNKIVEEYIDLAPDQFRISVGEIDITKRALASYETEEQLNSLLEEPNRLKFRSYSLVYFLKKIDASELYKKESIKKYYNGIVMDDSDFNSLVSYEVVFPDGHTETIKSRHDIIDYTCSKKYYQSERFYGTLNDHMNDWIVTQSDDYTKFIIGKSLVPETIELRVVCYDPNMNPIETPSGLSFSLGTFYTQNSILVLSGDEIDKDFVCSSNDERIRPEFLKRAQGVIAFKIVRQYCYDVYALFGHVSKKINENISEIKLYKKKQSLPLAVLTKKEHTYLSELSPEKIEYEIPETLKYSSTRAGFGDDARPLAPQFQKKDTVDVELIIQNESIIRSLNKNTVTCYYRTANDKMQHVAQENQNDSQGKKQGRGYPHELNFKEDGHLVIKELPLGYFSCKIRVSGYREEKRQLTLYPKDKAKQIELTFERTPLSKALRLLNKYKGRVAIFFIGLFIGGFIRPYLNNPQNSVSDNKNIQVLRDSVTTLKEDTANLHREVVSLERRIFELDSINNGLLKTKGSQASAIGQVAAEVNAQSKDETHPDAIKKIIQLLNKDKGDIKNKNSFVYKQYYNKLSKSEKNKIEKVLNHPAYPTTSIPSHITTITEAVNYLNNSMGG